MRNKNILIFGSTGFIGRSLVKRLLSEGANSIEQSAVKITREITPGLTST